MGERCEGGNIAVVTGNRLDTGITQTRTHTYTRAHTYTQAHVDTLCAEMMASTLSNYSET